MKLGYWMRIAAQKSRHGTSLLIKRRVNRNEFKEGDVSFVLLQATNDLPNQDFGIL